MAILPGTPKFCSECSRIFSDGSVETYGRPRIGLPSHITELRWVQHGVISIEGRLASGSSFTVQRDLDLQIGNNNGCFLLGARDFSKTARGIYLDGSYLHAQLLSMNQVWQAASLPLGFPVCESEDALEVRALDIPDIGYRYDHHRSRESLQRAIGDGCVLCNFVAVDCHGDDEATTFLLEPFVFSSPTHNNDGDTKDIYRLIIGNSNKVSRFAIRLAPTADFERQLAADAARRTTTTGSLESVHLAKTWLGQCLSMHEKCPKGGGSTWHPTRLLEVSESTVKLVLDVKPGTVVAYATLSHCWGEQPSLLLTTQTLARMMSGVAVGEFDRTFRDAFAIVRSLGLTYIWIDCYCIMQGLDVTSTTDWEQESMKMHLVYTNAVINIGATHGANSRAGCFKQRPDRLAFQQIVRWRPLQSRHTKVYDIQAWGDGEANFCNRFFQNPLFKRGWVVQERLLAPRMLHFGVDHLSWECAQTALTSDQYPHGTADSRLSKPSTYTGPGSLTSTAEASGLTLSLSELWRGTFWLYGQSRLSYPNKDKLRALEGVGQRIAELKHARYRNGYMDVELPYALCWRVLHQELERSHERRVWSLPSMPARTPEQLRAPTWHWSSSDQSIDYQLVLKYLPYRLGNEKYSRSPLIYTLPERGPFAPALQRGTLLWCLGRPLAVDSYQFDRHQYLIIHLLNSDDSPSHRYSLHERQPQDNLLCFCDWKDLNVYNRSGPAKLFLLPVYAQRHTGGTDESIDVQRRRIFDCWKVIPTAIFSANMSERSDRAGFGALLLVEMEDGHYARVGVVLVKSSSEPWAYQEIVRAMQRTAPRLITVC